MKVKKLRSEEREKFLVELRTCLGFVTIWLLCCLVIVLAGCATGKTEEGEWREQVDRANWANCEALYARAGVPTQHRHLHRDRYPFPKREDYWDDLLDNACKVNLGDEWIEY